MITSKEIRQQFIDFFKEKAHKFIPSSPVVPVNDPTLLFTNAGMNQFKDIFLGQTKPDYTRAVNSQKCIRAGGKHNDLDEVGKDGYHHTFFEMLGNWSFGDYYKKEAIQWAWELLTTVWKLPKDKLYATVHHSDDEAFELWKNETDIDHTHISKHGDKDNFWEMGETGPCGPCSEIHIDRGETFCNKKDDKNHICQVNGDCHRYIELWNLVFMQYQRHSDKSLTPLQNKFVDTGAGFERLCQVLQNKTSNYETDIFIPIIEEVVSFCKGRRGVDTEHRTPNTEHRVIADHIRALTFAIADGGIPSNEGRGYVLRRILRRAARYGRNLNLTEPFLYKLVDTVIENMGAHFSELIAKKEFIKTIIKAEEERFNQTLDKGLALFEEIIQNTISAAPAPSVGGRGGAISGKDAFTLYDTYGFPLDLTKILAEERGLTVDEAGFNQEMEKQKQRAREASNFKMKTGDEIDWIYLSAPPELAGDTLSAPHELAKGQHTAPPELAKGGVGGGDQTHFIGYDTHQCTTQIIKYALYDTSPLRRGQGVVPASSDCTSYDISTNSKLLAPTCLLSLAKTPFYAESGGQVADKGRLYNDTTEIEITDVQKDGDTYIHYGKIVKGTIDKSLYTAEIDTKNRQDTAANHTATHLLHIALKKTLGGHIAQKGSWVSPERLRFDFTHHTALKTEEILQVETIVNDYIRQCHPVSIEEKSIEQAKADGAVALFGEKYGDIVRVVSTADSMELCGGTHTKNTGAIGLFKILSESSISAGVRRIEAITGDTAHKYFLQTEKTLAEINALLTTNNHTVIDRLHKLLAENKDLTHQIEKLNSQNSASILEELIQKKTTIAGIDIVSGIVKAQKTDDLKAMGDILKEKLKNGIAILVAEIEGKASIISVVTSKPTGDLQAGKIVAALAPIVDGKGGGRPDMAMAGGKAVENIQKVIDEVPKLMNKLIINN